MAGLKQNQEAVEITRFLDWWQASGTALPPLSTSPELLLSRATQLSEQLGVDEGAKGREQRYLLAAAIVQMPAIDGTQLLLTADVIFSNEDLFACLRRIAAIARQGR